MPTGDGPAGGDGPAPGDTERWRGISSRNLARFWQHPVRAAGGRWARWGDAWAADAAGPVPYLNSATLQRPLVADEAASLVERLGAFYGAGPGGPWMLWSAWPTPDLRPYGMALVGHPPLMVRPPGGALAPPPPGLDIVEVADDAELRAYERVFIEGYPVPEIPPDGDRRMLGPRAMSAPLRLWVGYVAGEPVSVASAYVGEEAVSVFMVATLPRARGKGYGAALTARALAAAPHLPAELQASDDGRPVYLRLGFQVITDYALWMAPRRADETTTAGAPPAGGLANWGGG